MVHPYTCALTGEQFLVSSEELALRDTIGVPPPTLSPDERARRVLARRNERVLFRRTCSGSGAPTISIHSPHASFPVYSQEYWWSDSWDQYAHGRDYDFSRGFFEQFADLYRVVPQLGLNAPNCENSDWNNQSCDLKNCYMMFCSGFAEQCMYGMWNTHSENCIDCTGAFYCRWCYQLFNCNNCFQCSYSDNLEQCTDCMFSRELISCTDCIACVGLQHKQYCYFNEQLTKSEYQRIKNELRLTTRSGVIALQKRFDEFQKRFPRRHFNGMLLDSSDGDYLIRTENVHNSYNFRESKNLWHCRDGWKCNDSIGLLETWTMDHCVETEGGLAGTHSGFTNKLWEGGEVWYSSHIYYSKEIFGCVSLRHAEYCILNKRYSKDEYHDLRARIIAQMKHNGEWGENFPIKDSPFAYNLSMAQEYFPLTKEQALQRGYRWEDRADSVASATVGWDVPDDINLVQDTEALANVIQCTESGKLFKLQKAELAFYKNQGIPLPVVHYDARFYNRMNKRRNPRKLHPGSCAYCSTPFLTTYPPDSGYYVACERCFSEHRDQVVDPGIHS
jgi:hypothetical protein